MNNNGKNNNTLTIGAGWIKQTKKGDQMLSFVGGNSKEKTELFVRTAEGDEIKVEKFLVFFNEKNSEDPKQEKWPDLRAVMFLE